MIGSNLSNFFRCGAAASKNLETAGILAPEDKISGNRVERPGLAKVLEKLRENDALVIWKLDRLGRSVKNLVGLVGDLYKQGIWLKSLNDSIDPGAISGRFYSCHG